ncbi:hypothetical protein [Helicobacter pametensis]|uniref:hypothetical protein n=1 Tax=Helicobacter pametensis TaxID=95149 RepID=UPI0004B62709|nr:hypothetical protein [Helicobacter pametensis]
MSKKRQILLNHVIQEYLKSGQPVGSQSLKISANIRMSSATIRNHFKVMMDEGLLLQTHISSGRIPTSSAFKTYWRDQIDLHQLYEFPSFAYLEAKSKEIGCFVGVFYPSRLRLLQTEVINQSFLSLDFGDGYEVILRYSQPLKRFLDDLIGMELEDIQSFCLQVHALEVFQALNALLSDQYQFCGARYLADFMHNSWDEKLFFEFCDGSIFKRLGNGIYFDETLPRNYLALIFDAKVGMRDARVAYCGELDKNYSIL